MNGVGVGETARRRAWKERNGTKHTSQLRTGIRVRALLTSSGKRRCERLPPALCSDASRSSRFCKVPSSRSRLQSWSARVAAPSEAKFSCKAQTRSPVGAAPFPWHEKHGYRSLNEPNFPRFWKRTGVYEEAARDGGSPGWFKRQQVGWIGRASYSPTAQIRIRENNGEQVFLSNSFFFVFVFVIFNL